MHCKHMFAKGAINESSLGSGRTSSSVSTIGRWRRVSTIRALRDLINKDLSFISCDNNRDLFDRIKPISQIIFDMGVVVVSDALTKQRWHDGLVIIEGPPKQGLPHNQGSPITDSVLDVWNDVI
mmetsp:Transcript_102095/g.295406  ORF Transcript_102095/g.295406 Transcript_102095/m.295406 type:complete len:124 (+) Transcript_102095:732-1103(+)